jgi:hypothetical protein
MKKKSLAVISHSFSDDGKMMDKSKGFRQPVHGYPPENNLASAGQVSMDTAVQPCEDRKVTGVLVAGRIACTPVFRRHGDR